jgi:phytoene dehydrogenase-like protein
MASGTRVVVVGGGIAGLAAGAFAARAGARVTVLERMSEPGGRARTREDHGFLFNMGPHALYLRGAAMACLRELGIDPAGASPPTEGGLGIRGDRLHALPGGFVSLLTTGLLTLSEKLELARLMARLPKLETDGERSTSLADYLQREIRHAGVRGIVEALVRVTTYAHAPHEISAGDALDQVRLGLGSGVRYLDGGWETLVASVADAAQRAGAEVRSGIRVTQVEHDAAARGVRLDGGELLPADAVILALGPGEASALVDDGGNAGLARAAADCLPVRAACLDLGLSHLPAPQRPFALGIDRATYFSVHSKSAKLAPEGAALVQVARYLAPTESPSREELESQFDAILDLMQPGWRAHQVTRRLMRDLVVVHDLPRAARAGLRGRTRCDVTGISNLWLAGDWIGPEGMLVDGSFASARAAANAAAGARRLGVAA